MLVDVAKRMGRVGSIGSRVKTGQSGCGSNESGQKILTCFAMSTFSTHIYGRAYNKHERRNHNFSILEEYLKIFPIYAYFICSFMDLKSNNHSNLKTSKFECKYCD